MDQLNVLQNLPDEPVPFPALHVRTGEIINVHNNGPRQRSGDPDRQCGLAGRPFAVDTDPPGPLPPGQGHDHGGDRVDRGPRIHHQTSPCQEFSALLASPYVSTGPTLEESS